MVSGRLAKIPLSPTTNSEYLPAESPNKVNLPSASINESIATLA
jgi:hypothetical protein